MNIADRIILAFYTVLMAAVSIVVICFALRLFSFEFVVSFLEVIPGRWDVLLAAIIVFFVSIRFLIAGISTGGHKEITVHIGDEGVVRVSLNAVRTFIEKTAAQVKGVHDVKAKLKANADTINVKIIAGVLPEVNIPETSRIIQKKIKESVKDTIGREVSEVELLFNTISYEAKSKQRFE